MAKSIFQTFRDRLVDLSTKNKSLYLPKTENSGLLDLKEFDFLNGENSFEIIRKAISSAKKISVLPETDPRIAAVNILSKSLSRISFKSQLIQEETGEHTLYLAWPFVEGKMVNGQILRAPLLLLGVKMFLENEQWKLKPDDSWQWNAAFVLAYNHAYRKSLDVEMLNEQLERISKDAVEFRTELSKMLEPNFAIQLNSNIFEDQLLTFPISSRSLDEENFKEGKLALKTYGLFGQFAQKSSFLFAEYDKINSNFGGKRLEQVFESQFSNDHNLPIPREEQLFPIFPLDASQENVLIKVRQGCSVVVEGPPGTGKSQLIANLVSDYCSRGKKVLVVSQKRAALDVVYQRLADVGFGDFLGLVHDYRVDQKSLFLKIKSQIESIEEYQEQNRGIDSIQLERDISQFSKTISRLSDKFETFRSALFDLEPTGIPIKAMYLKASLYRRYFEETELLKLDYQQALTFEREFRVYHAYHSEFKATFWENRISFSHFEPTIFSRITQTLKEIENFRSDLIQRNIEFDYLRTVETFFSEFDFPERIESLTVSFNRLENQQLGIESIFDKDLKHKLTKVQNWLLAFESRIQEIGFDFSFSADILTKLEFELDYLEKKVDSWWGKLQVKMNRSKYPLTFNMLEESGMEADLKSISLIQSELRSFQNIRKEFSELPKIDGFDLTEFSFGGIVNRVTSINAVIEWAKTWKNSIKIQSLRNWDNNNFKAQLGELADFIHSFQTQSVSWKSYLSNSQILDLLRGQPDFANNLQLNQTFSELVAFDSFLENCNPSTLSIFKSMESKFSDTILDELIAVFWNSWYLTWITHLEIQTPVLAQAGSIQMKEEMVELKEAILEKRKLSKFIAQLRLREQVSQNLEFNRLGNRLTYRELHHQVSKKRQKWPIRKLIEEFGEEIFRLLPCWLASPETVSGLFTLEQDFDLVIFDEASQCQVERGFPAMLRGKQVVIAGDSKQLRPSDYYQVKIDSEEEGIAHESESLLELASSFFEKHQLKGHYRSADPALIHFSSTHFYGDQLETLPDYQTVLLGKPAFSWEKVEGIWENQKNIMEADAVCEKVKNILAQAPDDTIGIVTGNYFQMELIREKLWKAGFQDARIKVRNIENVQGDEFDQVILSLGYAQNRDGKLVTNFGLLGKSGAENRLNVAITRARKMMHVISSIEPTDFRPGQLQNPGLVLLKEFLTFVNDQNRGLLISQSEVVSDKYESDWSLKNRLLNKNTFYSGEIPSKVMDLISTESDGLKNAILTDDHRFFNAPSAKASMGYHPILLEQKGWSWRWEWSRGFFIQEK